MVLTGFVGFNGMTAGCQNAMFLREGRVPDLNTAVQNARAALDTLSVGAMINAAKLSAMLASVKVTFPLSLAQAILGGLLVVASGLAMGGRRNARSLAIQAVLASALLAVADFVLTRGMRAQWIDTVVGAASTLPAGQQRESLSSGTMILVLLRIKLMIVDLGPLALALLALTRGRTKAFFEAVARATEGSAEEP
jgi:hypothetical protein